MLSFFRKIKQGYKTHPVKGRLFLFSSILLALLLIARIALPYTVKYSTLSWLDKQGIKAHIKDISFDILHGKLLLKNVSGKDKENHFFALGNLNIAWQWSPLSQKIIRITAVNISNVKINIERYSDTTLISGINLASLTRSRTYTISIKNNKRNLPDSWGVSLGTINLSNINVCYQQYNATYKNSSDKTRQLNYCAHLKKMTWDGILSYGTDRHLLLAHKLPVISNGNLSFSDFSIQDKLLNRDLIQSKQGRLNQLDIYGPDNITLNSIVLNNFSALQKNNKQYANTIQFNHLDINKIKLTQLNKLSIHNITLRSPELFFQKGDNGYWAFRQWIHSAGDKQHTNKITGKIIDKKPSDVFTVNFNNITIKDAYFCYDDQTSTNFYCLRQNRLSWKGKGELSTRNNLLTLSGNLTLNKTTVTSKTINRQFFSLDRLALSHIKLESINSLTISEIRLDTFSALQRSEKINDNTVWFNTFRIKSFNLGDTKNINIKTVDLTGLGIQISKNKDGSWEQDKWLTRKHQHNLSNKKSQPPTNKSKSNTLHKSFDLVVNKLTLKTGQPITFRDNSLKPAMHVGINRLNLDVKHIDSTKPDRKLTFTLAAKSTRHATLNLSGYALPFQPEPSFDAKGKLTGFDLRAFSAETEALIGHTIKSGQMDAKLNLIAVKGQLKSNINLTLYQFNLQSSSKKDTEALDKKFGMPVNQSLALLRNKDGSIHLDIPVTGDIDNPDFDPTDAIIKAVSKAATVTLITFYTPYGLIYAGGNLLFDLATSMNFKPLVFAAGSSELSTDSKKQLNTLAKMLTKKPQLHLTLCGISNYSDREKLFPQAATRKNSANSIGNTIAITKAQKIKLDQLARERQQRTRNYLVKIMGTGHSQLILCAPQYNSASDAIAGVKINI